MNLAAAPSASAASSPPKVPPGSAPPASGPAPPPGSQPAPSPPAPIQGTSADVGAARHDALRVLDWSVRGASKVVGDATVGFARIQGVATVGGKLTATDVTVRGTLNVVGTTEIAHRLVVHGTARLAASVRAVEIACDGRTLLEGDLQATEAVALAGSTEIAGDLTAGSLSLRGAITTPGTVRVAGDLHASLSGGRSRTGPIYAQRVEILRPRFPPWRAPGELRTLRIEGTELHLEGVTAEFVKGTAIFVGAGCRLSRVEGPIVERHRDSTIGPSAVSDDIPPGLWR